MLRIVNILRSVISMSSLLHTYVYLRWTRLFKVFNIWVCIATTTNPNIILQCFLVLCRFTYWILRNLVDVILLDWWWCNFRLVIVDTCSLIKQILWVLSWLKWFRSNFFHRMNMWQLLRFRWWFWNSIIWWLFTLGLLDCIIGFR